MDPPQLQLGLLEFGQMNQSWCYVSGVGPGVSPDRKHPAMHIFDCLDQRFLYTKVTNHVCVEHLPVHVVAFSPQVYGKPLQPVQLRVHCYHWILSLHIWWEMEDCRGNLHANCPPVVLWWHVRKTDVKYVIPSIVLEPAKTMVLRFNSESPQPS